MPGNDRIVERLRQIAEHDWRVSFLAHTSDTAKEAAARIEELEGALREAETSLRNGNTAGALWKLSRLATKDQGNG